MAVSPNTVFAKKTTPEGADREGAAATLCVATLMAPKPKTPAPGKGAGDGKKADKKAPETGGDEAAPVSTSNAASPTNKEEVITQVNLEGLPHCPNEQILDIIRDKYEHLSAVFIHYCKQSECKTMEQATRLRLGEHAWSHPPTHNTYTHTRTHTHKHEGSSPLQRRTQRSLPRPLVPHTCTPARSRSPFPLPPSPPDPLCCSRVQEAH